MKNTIFRLIPLILTSVIISYSVSKSIISGNSKIQIFQNTKHALAIVALLVNWIIVGNRKSFYFLTLLILLLASINIINLRPVQTGIEISIRIGELKIGTPSLNYESFGLLLLFLLINYDKIHIIEQFVVRLQQFFALKPDRNRG